VIKMSTVKTLTALYSATLLLLPACCGSQEDKVNINPQTISCSMEDPVYNEKGICTCLAEGRGKFGNLSGQLTLSQIIDFKDDSVVVYAENRQGDYMERVETPIIDPQHCRGI